MVGEFDLFFAILNWKEKINISKYRYQFIL